ncbi:MAG: Hpt domain-containing protein, partial [Pseudomonadota bacterium]
EITRAHRIEQWMSADFLIRIAIGGEQAVEQLIERRPDIVWLLLENQSTEGLALASQMRGMQLDAYEAPSWIVALASDTQPSCASSGAEMFDQVLPEPRSQSACVATFLASVAAMPKTNGAPWIQQATEEAMPGFLASRQKLANTIRQAVADGRRTDAARSAHTLAGSPGMHNFESGVSACRYIEHHHATANADELLIRADEIRDLLAHIELR